MRIGVRTGRRSGVAMGPFGWALLFVLGLAAGIYAALLLAALVAAVVLVALLVAGAEWLWKKVSS